MNLPSIVIGSRVPDTSTATESTKRAKSIATIARITIFSIALLATLIPFQVGDFHNEESASHVDQYLKMHGYYAMDVSELKQFVKEKNLVVYWTGPIPHAMYTLDASDSDRISVRYVTGSRGFVNSETYFRVVSTYRVPGSYHIVHKVAQTAMTVTFTRADGNPVLFYKKTPSHVYVAFKSKDIQIEIFDPRPNEAFTSALSVKGVAPI